MTGPAKIDHIGVIVQDLDQASASFTRVLGVAPCLVKELPKAGLRLARFEAANVAIELIEYIDGGGGFGRRVMGDAAGLNHISIDVDDVPSAVERLVAGGLALQDGFPDEGSTGPVAFFEPDAASGVLFEVSRHDGKRQK